MTACKGLIYVDWHNVPFSPKTEDKESSVVEVVHAKDFVFSSFKVAINRCQQAALDVASAKIPCPADQLELLNLQRTRKESSHLSFVYLFIINIDQHLMVLEPVGTWDFENEFHAKL